MACRSSLGLSVTATPSFTGGMGGKSSASMPLIVASLREQRRRIWRERWATDITILSLGSVFTKSVSRRAGTVIAPSSSICPPIQQLIVRLWASVATSLIWSRSVAMRTLDVIGLGLRTATARPTMLSPRESASWVQETFINVHLLKHLRGKEPPRGVYQSARPGNSSPSGRKRHTALTGYLASEMILPALRPARPAGPSTGGDALVFRGAHLAQHHQPQRAFAAYRRRRRHWHYHCRGPGRAHAQP